MKPKNVKEYQYAARRLKRGVKTIAELQEELSAWDDGGEPIMTGCAALMTTLSRIAMSFERAAANPPPTQQDLPF